MASNPINTPAQYQKYLNNAEVQQRRNEYLPKVQAVAEKYNLPPGLLDASIMQESKYDPTATGDNGDSHGLSQIQDATARQYGIDPSKLYDPNYSIEAMGKIYAGLRDQIGEDAFSDWGKARVAYQAGPGAVGHRDDWGPVTRDNYQVASRYQKANSADNQSAPQQVNRTNDALGISRMLGIGGSGGSSAASSPAQSTGDSGYSSGFGGNVGTQQVKSQSSPRVTKLDDGQKFRARPYQDFYAQTFGKPWEYGQSGRRS